MTSSKPLSPRLLIPQERGCPAAPPTDAARLRRYTAALKPLMKKATIKDLESYLDRIDRGQCIQRRIKQSHPGGEP